MAKWAGGIRNVLFPPNGNAAGNEADVSAKLDTTRDETFDDATPEDFDISELDKPFKPVIAEDEVADIPRTQGNYIQHLTMFANSATNLDTSDAHLEIAFPSLPAMSKEFPK